MQKKVYIVEDDADIGDVVGFLLTGLGKEPYISTSIQEFKHRMNEQKPDLIIVDIRLPDGNGIMLCNQLKDDPATAHIPVILMSANTNMVADTRCSADEIIQKPFRVVEFESCIMRHLANEAGNTTA